MFRLVCFVLIVLLPSPLWAAEGAAAPVSAWWILPFGALLVGIAIGPFVNRAWWEKYYPHVSLGLGFLVFGYYLMSFRHGRMLHTLLDYFSFITLIGSLFVAAGGIYFHTERRAHPVLNTAMLAVGAVISNLLGTTGASMLLIRPYLRINKPRIRSFHVVFFIFVVSNLGGALTPIGDPPLFLGYLNGVPFDWTIRNIWPIWLVGLGLVLLVFLVLDTLAYRKWADRGRERTRGMKVEIIGSHNLLFLGLILVAVFAQTPIRELIMIVAATAAHTFARKEALKANEFSFTPIREVAILFAGIFTTMVPALDWLALNAHSLGITSPGQFYWASGTLSSFLDNAPTYLNFLTAALGLHGLTLGNQEHMNILLGQHAQFLLAISVGSVFFGAVTYIGNGPNFMVKSIAEHSGVECPSFFGYMVKYSIPVLLPVFTLIWFFYFR